MPSGEQLSEGSYFSVTLTEFWPFGTVLLPRVIPACAFLLPLMENLAGLSIKRLFTCAFAEIAHNIIPVARRKIFLLSEILAETF